ncbi:MAG TPA: acetyl-CoA carboxylase biotin carboxyl carrier protein [Nitrospinae bacterium]|nr:acetyl-CoA carboxylase biotin carboxyl carrier protein [Nitrospinota bacterium]
MDLKELKRLVELFEKSSISELEIDEKGTKVRLRKGGAGSAEVSAYRHITHTPPSPHQASLTQTKTEEVTAGIKHKKVVPQGDNYVIVESPMVGTFYRASSEGSAPYVKEGDVIEKGQVLCIVEAMKLMNEIESEVRGRIVSILIENAHSVEFGEPMFVIEKV